MAMACCLPRMMAGLVASPAGLAKGRCSAAVSSSQVSLVPAGLSRPRLPSAVLPSVSLHALSSFRSRSDRLSWTRQVCMRPALPRHACRRTERTRPALLRLHISAEGRNQSLAAHGQENQKQEALVVAGQPKHEEAPSVQLVSLNGALQGALMAALLQGVVDPVGILAACVLGLTITLVDMQDVRALLQKAASLVTSRPPTQQDLQLIISNLERLLEESQSGHDPALAARHKAELEAAMAVLLQSRSPVLPSSDSTNKRITSIVHAVLEQLGSGLASVEGSLSAEQLQSSLAPVVAAAAARFQPVTSSLQSGASQMPSLPTLLRYVVSALPQVGTPASDSGSSMMDTGGVAVAEEWERGMGARAPTVTPIFVPLALSSQLSNSQTLKVQVYAQQYVLFRPRDGEVAALADSCPHRGASLSMGTLVGTSSGGKCVKCPYHGLEFNATGGCNKPNIFTSALDVVEANGVVWLREAPLEATDLFDFEPGADELDLAPFLRSFREALGAPMSEASFLAAYSEQQPEGGDEDARKEEAPPFADHFGVAGFRAMGGFVDIAAPPKAVVDNTFDLHHMTHVHKTTFGGGQLIRTWKPNDTTICFEYGMSSTNPFTSFFGDGRVRVKMERAPPYSAMVTVGDTTDKVVLKTLTHVVPLTENSSRLIWQLLRNFGTLPVLDPVFQYSVKRILAEDQAVLEGVNLSGVREGMDLGI